MNEVLEIGSGFGGGVAALRLAEKGYGVTVVDAGRRFRPEDFPRTSWRLRRFLWACRIPPCTSSTVPRSARISA